MMLFVDGILDAEIAQTGNINSVASNVKIGVVQGYEFNGLIDQVQIYNTALSQSDIKRVMLGMHPLNG